MLFLFQFFCFPFQLSNNRKGDSYYIILHYSCMFLVLSSSSPPSSHIQYYYCMYTYARVKCNEIFPHRQQTRQTQEEWNEKRTTRNLSNKNYLDKFMHIRFLKHTKRWKRNYRVIYFPQYSVFPAFIHDIFF